MIILLVPESNEMLSGETENTRVVRFPDEWTKPLKIATAPVTLVYTDTGEPVKIEDHLVKITTLHNYYDPKYRDARAITMRSFQLRTRYEGDDVRYRDQMEAMETTVRKAVQEMTSDLGLTHVYTISIVDGKYLIARGAKL